MVEALDDLGGNYFRLGRHLSNREMALISLLRWGAAKSSARSPATVEEVLRAEEQAINKARQRHGAPHRARKWTDPLLKGVEELRNAIDAEKHGE